MAYLDGLGTHPDDDRRRLLADPRLLVPAMEEMLRAYAPVMIGRLARQDVELGGRCVPAGDRVVLPFGAANRDPAVSDDPDEVRIDRAHNRHLTFGAGPHWCLGMHLARLELRVGLPEWLGAIPDYHLVAPEDVAWSAGPLRGPERLDFEVGA